MCLAYCQVTNLHAVDPAHCELAFQAFSPCRPDPRAHLGAASRVVARTPVPYHANVIVGSAVRRGGIHAVPVARRRALDRVWRLGVDAYDPIG